MAKIERKVAASADENGKRQEQECQKWNPIKNVFNRIRV